MSVYAYISLSLQLRRLSLRFARLAHYTYARLKHTSMQSWRGGSQYSRLNQTIHRNRHHAPADHSYKPSLQLFATIHPSIILFQLPYHPSPHPIPFTLIPIAISADWSSPGLPADNSKLPFQPSFTFFFHHHLSCSSDSHLGLIDP